MNNIEFYVFRNKETNRFLCTYDIFSVLDFNWVEDVFEADRFFGISDIKECISVYEEDYRNIIEECEICKIKAQYTVENVID